ncbi:probable helicase senataxin [Xyrauchen texanus]|uniref:probable helicase senataxin n=1 Tax=Xyrauchen texanus TaxID=154827 RepID=UPI0022423A9F|nr:probable helicase senataxin [Xyrauchen texanus]XP_051960454.1 probable helicase senataxin [Xyrauchen texanus]
MMEKCLWCTTSLEAEGDVAMVALLHRYCSGLLSEREMDSLNEDLKCCLECVVEYHRARDKVPELHKRLWEMEKARLLQVLRSTLDQELEEEDDDLFIIEDDLEQPVSKISPIEFQIRLRFPLFEVLKYPYLLCYRELGDLVVKALCTLQDMKQSLNVFEKYQGTYLLLVHPNEKVRRWAIDAAKTMRSVDRDAYYDLQEIFSCMFYVIELGISLDFPDLDQESYAEGTVPRLPSHLYDSHNKKNYWLGICMLLTQLSAEAMDSLFMGQFNIPLCIINTIEGLKNEDDPASDPFWPALHCFMVILDRLGSKVWGQVDPNMAFQTITGAASYVAEIRNVQQKTIGRMVKMEPEIDDNVVTCSQIVYDCYGSKKTRQESGSSYFSGICNYVIYEDMQSLVNVLDSEMGQSMRVYGSTFLWFIPFVRSIMELPELNASYISEVIHYLCDKIRDNRTMLTGQTNLYDKVTEFFTRILIQIIELHSSKGRMGILSQCAPKWVEVIVMCTVLSDEQWNAVPPDRMGGIHRVSSTSNSLGVVGQLPASGGGTGAIILGCMMLIRQLLKERIRTGSDPHSTHFLNLLNKQLRGVPNKRWSLTSSESSELQQCLVRVVRSFPERSSSPALFLAPSTNVVPPNAVISKNSISSPHQKHGHQEAGPSRAGHGSALIKEEPLWDYVKDKDLRGFQDIIKAKKEPTDPVQISEMIPDVKFAHIKSELGNVSRSSCSYFKEEYNFKAEDDDGYDDEPLDIRRNRLMKSHKLKSSDSEVDGIDVQLHSRTTGTSKGILESSTFISDNKVSENDERPSKEILSSCNKIFPVKNEFLEDPDSHESPVRDYNDLSDSDVDPSVFTNKLTLDHTLEQGLEPAPNDFSPSWSTGIQLVPDENIERACRQAEDKIRQQQQPQEPAVSCALSSSKAACIAENFELIKPKPPPDTSQKRNQSDKRDILQFKKLLIIEALGQEIRHNLRKRRSLSQDNSPPTASTSSTLPSHSMSSSSVSSPTSASTSRGVPAIVPPKKVCEAVEPKSTAEHLGLKKKERRAFDLPQHSLDSVAKLRCHGQNVQLEPKPKRSRVCHTNKTSPQKCMGKGNKKLLASQDMQFFRQSREKHQRPTTLSPTTMAPQQTRSPQPGEIHLSKPTVAAKEDCTFFPCPPPDPDPQQDNEKAATRIKNNTSENIEARGDGVGNGSMESKNVEFTDVGVNTEGGTNAKEEFDVDWMFLTQTGASDMELCSHLDQFEEENEAPFLTQRDPVDRDLDPVSESDTPGQPISVAHKPLQTPHTPHSDAIHNDLFLKPGISPMSQKKAKPSTTKIYTPSSRSESLVREMEKGAKPPLAPNVVKPKVFRSPSAIVPTKTIPTLPSPQLPQPFPSKQIYHRPETPVHKPVPVRDTSPEFDLSVLTQAILKWEYRMLKNYKTFGSPDDLCSLPLKEVPLTFPSYLEYFNTLYPLLLINSFEEMASEWLKEGRVSLFLNVQGVEYRNCTASASFMVDLNPDREKKRHYPKEDDLVLLYLLENTGEYANDESDVNESQSYFGYVSRSSVSNRGPGSHSILNLTIQTRGNVSLVNSKIVHCKVIGSLISTFREFRALCLLRNGPMLRPFLAPHLPKFTHTRDYLQERDPPGYNENQARAIACALAMIKRPKMTPEFLIIHGPPGTGKSKTIVGLLFKLLSSGSNGVAPEGNLPSKTRRTRVLLCAPSNTAIDSLMKKVIVIFKEKCRDIKSPQGNCGDINLVRLGSERTISNSLKHFSLDHQTKVRAERFQQTVEADLQRQKEQLDQSIENLSQRCAKAKKDSAEFKTLIEEKLQLLKEREGLSRKIKAYRAKRQETQAVVLQNAHVICCTLSTSGSIVLENAFRRHGREPFSCIIIDEASQAKETETLIPMLYRCPTVILVGDINQLPPTVVSKKAKEFGYDQSLMARLCKSLQSNPQPSPILFLNVQYRMHPDICEFPSKYIYNNALKTDPETAGKRWHLKPYRVFDVTDGRENKERDSFINLKEVKLVVLLLKLLVEKSVRVGVITPYNAQKQRILDAIGESGIDKHLQVEVDTVDGFLGREMDCIIMSCVSTSSEMGSIEFVGNRQRMNVTITRAKFSLFILGHLRTLRQQRDWGALIEDAWKRGTIIKTLERDFQSDARKILKPAELSRSLSHPPIRKPSTVTSPVTHGPMETAQASTSRNHRKVEQRLSRSSSMASAQPQLPMPRMIPLDCPRGPQTTDRPTDPRFAERQPIREQRLDREGQGLSASHHLTHRATSYDRDSRNGDWGSRNGDWGSRNGDWGSRNGDWGSRNGDWGSRNRDCDSRNRDCDSRNRDCDSRNGDWGSRNGDWGSRNSDWGSRNSDWDSRNRDWDSRNTSRFSRYPSKHCRR